MLFKSVELGCRSGVLKLNGVELATPAVLVSTTRGAIPHLTPDHSSTPVAMIHAQDFLDFKGFVNIGDVRALPLCADLVIANARRAGASGPTKPNTDESIGFPTVQGYKLINVRQLATFMTSLKPDLLIVPHDAATNSAGTKPGANRLVKTTMRSRKWYQHFHDANARAKTQVPLIAEVPPELQTKEYIESLGEIHGIAFVPSGAQQAPFTPPLTSLWPGLRVYSSGVSIHRALEMVQLGMDLVCVKLDEYTDSGRMLNFRLDCSTEDFALDLFDKKYAKDFTSAGMSSHSKAYVHHLLCSREMTATVIIQQHNLRTIQTLFADVREALENRSLAEKISQFKQHYPED